MSATTVTFSDYLATVTFDDGVIVPVSFAAAGLKGDKGDTPSLVDTLISTSVTDALTANQGRVINERVTGVEGGSNYAAYFESLLTLP